MGLIKGQVQFLNHILYYLTEITIILLETILIFSKIPFEIAKEYTIENSKFPMTLMMEDIC